MKILPDCGAIYMAGCFQVCILMTWFLFGWEDKQTDMSAGLEHEWRLWCKPRASRCRLQPTATRCMRVGVLLYAWGYYCPTTGITVRETTLQTWLFISVSFSLQVWCYTSQGYYFTHHMNLWPSDLSLEACYNHWEMRSLSRLIA